MGKLALLAAVLAVVFAVIPMVQYEEMSAGEKFITDLKDSVKKLERHVQDDSKFTFSLEGKDRWHSLAMICAVVAVVLGLVSLAGDLLVSAVAIIIGAAVGLWQYFGT